MIDIGDKGQFRRLPLAESPAFRLGVARSAPEIANDAGACAARGSAAG
jgi:hypothetical protein